LFTALLLVDFAGKPWIVLALLALDVLAVALLVVPTGAPPSLRIIGQQHRVDERDVIFHRFNRLEPGTPEFDEHYRAHPEQVDFDEKVRALPRLGHPGSRSYDRLTAPFQVAIFDVLEQITRKIDWPADPIEESPAPLTPEEATRRLKGFGRYLGADLVGTTKLNPNYVYSHIGRSPGTVGEPIELNHTHAIVFGEEMSHDMVRHAPDSATTTETAFKYFEGAKIAMLVARYINLLGYEARAHVDGNYRVMCGPIAVDAGLGELGRLGLLMTPEFGPRLRLSVVTTNLPLLQDPPITFGVQHFCDFCKKCATNCPSRAIDAGDKADHNGVEKWQSSQQDCYRFWRIQGSDCALCVKVCPYSHPGTPMHNLVRWAIRRNSGARRAALWADDLFYGRRPGPRPELPEWHARP
jgi:ferredoxin